MSLSTLLKFKKKSFSSLPLASFLSVFIALHSAAEVDPKIYEEALASYHDGDHKASIIYLKNILAEDKNHLASRVLMAENLLAQGDGIAAEIELNVAQNEGAAIDLLAPLFARAYLMQNKFDNVLLLPVEKSTTPVHQSQMHAYHGLAYLGKNALKQAQVEFHKALTINPTLIDAMLGQAKVDLKREQQNEAFKKIQQVLTLAPEHKQALLMAAITQKQLNNSEAAYQYINQLLEISPENYTALLVRASLLMEMNKHELVIADIEKIMTVMPNEPIANYIKLLSAQANNDVEITESTQLHLESVMGAISDDIMNEQPIYYFLKGLISFQAGAMESAEKAFAKYHKIFPNDTRVLKLLGRIEINLDNAYAARKYFMKAYLIDETDQETWRLLGQVNLLTGNFERSEFYFNKILTAEPNSLSAVIDLAKLLLLKGDNAKSITLLNDALAPNSTVVNDGSESLNFQLLLLLAKAYEQNNMPVNGLNVTNVLIKNYSDSSPVNQIHAVLLGLSGDLLQAKFFLERAIALDENNNQAVIHLARIETYQGNTDAAIALLKHQLLKGKSSALMIELGDVYHYLKDENEALTWYQKALSTDQGNVVALRKVVGYFERKGDIQEALKVVHQYLDAFNDNGEVHLIAANLYVQSRQNAKALTEMNLAVKYSQNKAATLLQQARMQLYFKEQEKAINSLKYAISVDATLFEAYELLIQLYKEENNTDEGLKILEQLTREGFPKETVSRLTGDMYSTIDPAKSLTFYQSSYKESPTKPALLGLYTHYNAQEKYTKIQTLLENWLVNHPNDLQVTLLLGENYKNSGDLVGATAFYDKHIANNPDNVSLLNNGAMINYYADDLNKALVLALRALKHAPKNVNIIDTNAVIELALGNKSKALSLLREANTLDYGNAEVKYHLALALDSLNRRNEAILYLQESVNSVQNFSEKDKALALLKAWNHE